jgi:hypothetical protein
VPRAWKRTEIVALAKVPTPRTANDTRGISLISHVAKVFSAWAARRLSAIPLGVWQCGFRPARGTMHAVATLQQLLQVFRLRRRRLHMVFIDCSKAFDSVDRSLLEACLLAYGVGPRIVGVVRDLLANDEVFVRGSEDEVFRSSAGVRQGDNASPVLFVIALDIAVQLAGLKPFMVRTHDGAEVDLTLLGYADDLVIIDDDPATLQANLDKLVAALALFGLQVNVKKTESFCTDPLPPRAAPCRPRHTGVNTGLMYRKQHNARKGIDCSLAAWPETHILTPTSDRLAPGYSRLLKPLDPTRSTICMVAPDAAIIRCPACPAEDYAVFKIDQIGASHLTSHVQSCHHHNAIVLRVKQCGKCKHQFSQFTNHGPVVCADAIRGRFLLKKHGAQHRPCARCGWLAGEHTCVGGLAPEPTLPLPPHRLVALTARNNPAHPQTTTTTTTPPHKFVVNGLELKHVDRFRYLGRIVSRDAGYYADFKRRMGAATAQLRQVARCLSRRGLTCKQKTDLLAQLVYCKGLYGSETWQLRAKEVVSLQAMQMQGLRIIARREMQRTSRPATTDEKRLRETEWLASRTGKKKKAAFINAPVVTYKHHHNVDVLALTKAKSVVEMAAKRRETFVKDIFLHRGMALPERAISDVREFTERHREMRTLYRDYRDIVDGVNPDAEDPEIDTSESDAPRDTSPAPGSEITNASDIVLSSDSDAESLSDQETQSDDPNL